MSKNNVIQLHNVLPILCKILKVYAIYGNTDEKNLYKRKPLDHVLLKLKKLYLSNVYIGGL